MKPLALALAPSSFPRRARALLSLLLAGSGSLWAGERIFILQDSTHVTQYQMEFESAVSMVHPYVAEIPGKNTLEASYGPHDLPQGLPAAAIEMKSGNILCTYDAGHHLLARFHYDPASNRLQPYQGQQGSPTSSAGRILENPSLEENFRADDSLYGRTKRNSYRASLLMEKVRAGAGRTTPVLFVLDGQVFGANGEQVSRFSDAHGALLAAPEVALTLPGAQVVAAATSPWDEAFLSDAAHHSVQRVLWHDGALTLNGAVTDKNLGTPAGLGFNADGELFVANHAPGKFGVLRFRLVLDNFVTWRAVAQGGLALAGEGALDLALARPVGTVVSEKERPLISVAAAGAHHGIAQSLLVYPSVNSTAAVLALVQYGPGGFTAVHIHPQMEQMEIVISGRALWEVGEVEREVGPGDVIYCPRNVKHGYKVLGDTPFKFYQVEWPGPGLYRTN